MCARHRFLLQCTVLFAVLAVLSGCASLSGRDAPHVYLAGIDSLPVEGLEARFMLKLRIQNPSDADSAYDGISTEIELRGQALIGIHRFAQPLPGAAFAIILTYWAAQALFAATAIERRRQVAA